MPEHKCLVCGYSGDLDFHPADYQICGCCGTEFGYDDRVLTHRDLRLEWIRRGFPWFDPEEPKAANWNPILQLIGAGFGADLLSTIPSTLNVSVAVSPSSNTATNRPADQSIGPVYYRVRVA